MSTDYRRAPQESPEARLHREYGWSKYDGAITQNGVVYREHALRNGLKTFKLFREQHHTDKQMVHAADELLVVSPGAVMGIEEIYTVESWGVAPAPGH